MTDESYVLVSLKDDKAKKLTQAINNESARGILEYLSHVKDATETKISKELKIPISTVHYNLKNLMDAKLIEASEFHYSEKGKEVNHYKLANKLIIIAPKETEDIRDALKKILPTTLIAGLSSLAMFLYTKFNTQILPQANNMLMAAAPEEAMMAKSRAVAYDMAESAADDAVFGAAADVAVQSEPNIALWFFLGSLFTILIYILVEYIRKRKNSNIKRK